jgi:DNA-binding NtrC family response regulator
LRACGWSREKAAHALGLPLRTLAYKMQCYDIRKAEYQKA